MLLWFQKNWIIWIARRKKFAKNITACEAYKMMTSNQPEWLRMLLNLRDILVKPAGVRAIQGFTNLDEDKYKSGQINAVLFFTITEDTADKLTLIVKDSHLDVCICVRIIENTSNPSKNILYLVASVRNHNFWGRLYMLPVSILHPFIAHKLVDNID